MKQLTVFLLILYWTAIIAVCYYTFHPVADYAYLSKSLTIPFLISAFLFQCRDSKHKTSRTILTTGLFFSFLGDMFKFQSVGIQNSEVLSIASSTTYSVLSLFCFLVTLFGYIFFFFRITPFKASTRFFKICTSFFIILFLVFFLSQILPKVIKEDLEVPVILRGVIIGVMLFSVINIVNGGRVKKLAYFYFIPGTILYVLSDSLNIIGLYIEHSIVADVSILLTYATAQFLIVRGAMRFLRK